MQRCVLIFVFYAGRFFLLPIRFDTSGSHQTSTQEQFHFVKKRSTLSTDKQGPSVFHVGTTQVTIWSHIITPREEILSASPLLVLYHDLLTEGEMHFMKEKVQCWLEMGCWSRKTADMIKWSCQMLILRWAVRWIQPLCRTWPTTPERCQFQRKAESTWEPFLTIPMCSYQTNIPISKPMTRYRLSEARQVGGCGITTTLNSIRCQMLSTEYKEGYLWYWILILVLWDCLLYGFVYCLYFHISLMLKIRLSLLEELQRWPASRWLGQLIFLGNRVARFVSTLQLLGVGSRIFYCLHLWKLGKEKNCQQWLNYWKVRKIY